jgi:hypothetical protein
MPHYPLSLNILLLIQERGPQGPLLVSARCPEGVLRGPRCAAAALRGPARRRREADAEHGRLRGGLERESILGMSTSLPLCAIQSCEIAAEHELFFLGPVLLIERGEKYADETATVLAEELLSGADEGTVIAVISAPSVFVQIRNILVSGSFSGLCSPLRLLRLLRTAAWLSYTTVSLT